MGRILIIFHSETGGNKTIAGGGRGVESVLGPEAAIKEARHATVDDLAPSLASALLTIYPT